MIREQALERDQDRKRVWLLGYDLRLIPSVTDVRKVPAAGRNLVVVADVKNVLHFRFFDSDGKVVVDINEKRLTKQAPQIEELRKQLQEPKELWPPHQLTGGEKGPIITAVASIVGHSALLKRKNTTANGDPLRAQSPPASRCPAT